MNIYFSCAVTGTRADQEFFQVIVNHLLEKGMPFLLLTLLPLKSINWN